MSDTDRDEQARALHPAGSARESQVTFDAAGVDEVTVVPWPMIVRDRLSRRRERPSKRLVLVVVLAGLFTVSVTITLLAVSLVDIADDLGSTPTTLSWVVTGPMLAFGVVGPAFGKAGDLYGQKKLFMLGLLGAGLFAVATVFAWDAGSLIAFRTLSATMGAATGPASMALINRVFDAHERVKALGYFSFVSAGAPVIGVVVGGPLVESIGWRAIFAVQAPLCFLGLVIAWMLLPETPRGPRVRFDVAGAALLGLSITLLLVSVNRGPVLGWTSPFVIGGFVLGVVCLLGFVRVEAGADEPLLPLAYLRRRNFTAPITSSFFTNFAYMGGFILTPVLLEKGLGFATAFVGLLIISRPLAFSIAAPTAGYFTVRVGERVSGVLGASLVFVSMLALAAIGLDSPTWFIILALALSGVGLGIASPAMTATVANSVSEQDLGVAGAVQQLLVQVGAVVGVQVMQTVQAGSEASAGLIPSYGIAYYVGAGACLVGVAVAFFVRPQPRTRRATASPVSAAS